MKFLNILILLISTTFCIQNKSTEKKIELVKYDEKWQEIYKIEAAKIRIALGSNFIEIHHFESTSVPELAAKSTKIDIMAVVKDLNKIESEKLEQAGYENREEVIKTGRYFIKENGRIHLHIFQKGNKNIENNLKFRDILKSNKKIREEYEGLKKDFAAKYKDPMEYSKQKTEFIQKAINEN